MRMKDGCNGPMNHAYINTANRSYQDFKMFMVDKFLKITHVKKGTFFVPLSSVSWMKTKETKAKKPGRPKKVAT